MATETNEKNKGYDGIVCDQCGSDDCECDTVCHHCGEVDIKPNMLFCFGRNTWFCMGCDGPEFRRDKNVPRCNDQRCLLGMGNAGYCMLLCPVCECLYKDCECITYGTLGRSEEQGVRN